MIMMIAHNYHVLWQKYWVNKHFKVCLEHKLTTFTHLNAIWILCTIPIWGFVTSTKWKLLRYLLKNIHGVAMFGNKKHEINVTRGIVTSLYPKLALLTHTILRISLAFRSLWIETLLQSRFWYCSIFPSVAYWHLLT